MLDELAALLDILEDIMDGYQMDIRERGLDAEGFCQGRVYLNAPAKVQRAKELVCQLREQAPLVTVAPVAEFTGDEAAIRRIVREEVERMIDALHRQFPR